VASPASATTGLIVPAPWAGPGNSAAVRDTAILGARQLRWLQREVQASTATWKVIASDMPIGLVVPDGSTAFEAVAQGRPEALGRELEVADLLSSLRVDGVRNVVWITADVHYAAAHHYDPARAAFTDFDPFWEFVAGPIHAGTFGPNALDATFGPEVRFQRAADLANQPPSDGLQFFGHVIIDGHTEVMTVRLIDVAGTVLHQQDLSPEP
jgi:alkaline phosphatase D